MKSTSINTLAATPLTASELACIRGGWHPFPHGLFGRKGKPFFGKDFVRIIVGTSVKIGVACIPGAAPYAAMAAALAQEVVREH